MKKKYVLLAFSAVCLMSCSTIDQMNELVNGSTYSISANSDAIQRSTSVIQQNAEVVDESTRVLEENLELLKAES